MKNSDGIEYIDGKLFIERRTLIENYPLHYHSFFEFEYVISGKGTVFIDNKPTKVEAGSLIFMTPYNFQTITVDEPLDIINCSFSSEYIDKSIIDFCENSIVLQNIPSYCFLKLCEEFYGDLNFKDAVIKSILNLYVGEAIRALTPEIIDKTIDISYRVAFYIRRHYKRNLTLTSIAHTFGYTPNYLCAIFKKNFNIPIKEYIINFRLEVALKLLSSTELSVSDVCYECGFSSLSNFLRSFKNKYGMTPKEKRAEIKSALDL